MTTCLLHRRRRASKAHYIGSSLFQFLRTERLVQLSTLHLPTNFPLEPNKQNLGLGSILELELKFKFPPCSNTLLASGLNPGSRRSRHQP